MAGAPLALSAVSGDRVYGVRQRGDGSDLVELEMSTRRVRVLASAPRSRWFLDVAASEKWVAWTTTDAEPGTEPEPATLTVQARSGGPPRVLFTTASATGALYELAIAGDTVVFGQPTLESAPRAIGRLADLPSGVVSDPVPDAGIAPLVLGGVVAWTTIERTRWRSVSLAAAEDVELPTLLKDVPPDAVTRVGSDQLVALDERTNLLTVIRLSDSATSRWRLSATAPGLQGGRPLGKQHVVLWDVVLDVTTGASFRIFGTGQSLTDGSRLVVALDDTLDGRPATRLVSIDESDVPPTRPCP